MPKLCGESCILDFGYYFDYYFGYYINLHPYLSWEDGMPGRRPTTASVLRRGTRDACVVAAAMCVTGVASAQSTAQGGIMLGDFRLDPSYSLSRDWTDNVMRAATGAVSDRVTHSTPSLSLRSSWKQHALNANLSATKESHERLRSESVDTHLYEVDGRIDASSTLHFPLTYSHARTTLKRGHPNEAGGRDRHSDTVNTLRAGMLWQLGAWQLDLGTQRLDSDAKNTVSFAGAVINRDDEDRVQYDHSIKLGYQIRQGVTAFGKLVSTRVDYRDPFDDNLVNRDSTGGTATAGVSIVLGPSRYVQLEAGHERRRFDGTLGNFSDTTATALAVWAFTPMLVGTASFSQMFQETVLPGSPGLGIHATTLNLTWGAGAPWRVALTASQIDSLPERLSLRYREDSVALAVGYTLNRFVQLGINRANNRQPANGAFVPGYRENVTTATLTLKY